MYALGGEDSRLCTDYYVVSCRDAVGRSFSLWFCFISVLTSNELIVSLLISGQALQAIPNTYQYFQANTYRESTVDT